MKGIRFALALLKSKGRQDSSTQDGSHGSHAAEQATSVHGNFLEVLQDESQLLDEQVLVLSGEDGMHPVFLVGRYLSRYEMTRCARVSRAWYRAMRPLIWQPLRITYPPPPDGPFQDLKFRKSTWEHCLKVNSPRIVELILNGPTAPHFLGLNYSALQSLTFSFKELCPAVTLTKEDAYLIRQRVTSVPRRFTATLVELSLLSMPKETLSIEFWQDLERHCVRGEFDASAQVLRSLTLEGATLLSTDTRHLLKVCQVLEMVALKDLDVTMGSEDAFSSFLTGRYHLTGVQCKPLVPSASHLRAGTAIHLPFENGSKQDISEFYHGRHISKFASITCLVLENIRGLEVVFQAKLIRECLYLEDLTWILAEGAYNPEVGFPVGMVWKIISDSYHWPNSIQHFTTFGQEAYSIPSEIMEAILCKTHPALGFKSFTAAGTQFDQDAFVALARHARTLQKVDLRYCPKIGSPLTQHLMSTCPRLEFLGANQLSSRDVCLGQRWVCLGLNTLLVDICIDMDVELRLPVRSSPVQSLVRRDSFPIDIEGTSKPRLSRRNSLYHLGDTSPSQWQSTVAPAVFYRLVQKRMVKRLLRLPQLERLDLSTMRSPIRLAHVHFRMQEDILSNELRPKLPCLKRMIYPTVIGNLQWNEGEGVTFAPPVWDLRFKVAIDVKVAKDKRKVEKIEKGETVNKVLKMIESCFGH